MTLFLKKIVKPLSVTVILWLLWQKYFFYGYYDKEYFKNNIKIIILLKWVWIKNNFETTVTNCGFKDISETLKITVTDNGFLHLKREIYVDTYVDIKD